MSDLAPILLRPSAALASAMTAAAEARGISRQAWMLAVLEGACSEYMTALTPDDVPLFPLDHMHIWTLGGECFFEDCDARAVKGVDYP